MNISLGEKNKRKIKSECYNRNSSDSRGALSCNLQSLVLFGSCIADVLHCSRGQQCGRTVHISEKVQESAGVLVHCSVFFF